MSDLALTVVARITARSGHEEELLAALRTDARDTLANEPGCTSFDILLRDGHPREFILLETYVDRQAFETHKAERNFKAFEDAVKRLAVDVPVITLLTNA